MDIRLPLVPKVKYLPLLSVTVAGSWQLMVPLSQVRPPSAEEKSASFTRLMPVL